MQVRKTKKKAIRKQSLVGARHTSHFHRGKKAAAKQSEGVLYKQDKKNNHAAEVLRKTNGGSPDPVLPTLPNLPSALPSTAQAQ